MNGKIIVTVIDTVKAPTRAGRLAGLDSTRIFPLALAHPFAWIYSGCFM